MLRYNKAKTYNSTEAFFLIFPPSVYCFLFLLFRNWTQNNDFHCIRVSVTTWSQSTVNPLRSVTGNLLLCGKFKQLCRSRLAWLYPAATALLPVLFLTAQAMVSFSTKDSNCLNSDFCTGGTFSQTKKLQDQNCSF